jgi:hypothetical protein
MPQSIFPIASAALCCLLALQLTACRPSQSSALGDQTAPQVRGELIHGDPINSTATAPPAILSAGAPAPAVVASPSEAKAVPANDGYATVGFDKLAGYDFEVDDAPWTNIAVADKSNDQIPPSVKALDDQKVSIRGFMLPLKVAAGRVTEFLIMKDQSTCCFGNVPRINDWVSVKTGSAGVKPIMDTPISILGTLHVGALRENGYLVSVYTMDADTLVGPK